MGRAISKDVQAFKRSYAQKPCIKDAALAAGYALNTAKQGITALPKPIRSFILAKQRKLDKLAKLGQSVNAEQQENIARGAILANIAAGKDAAVQSIKMAGQDRRVNMFQSDVQTGLFVIEIPAHLTRDVKPQVIEATDVKQLAGD